MDVQIDTRGDTLTLLLRLVQAGDHLPGAHPASRRRRHRQRASLAAQVRPMLTDGAAVARADEELVVITLPGWTRRRAERLLGRLRAWVLLDERLDLQGAVVGGSPGEAGYPRTPTVSTA